MKAPIIHCCNETKCVLHTQLIIQRKKSRQADFLLINHPLICTPLPTYTYTKHTLSLSRYSESLRQSDRKQHDLGILRCSTTYTFCHSSVSATISEPRRFSPLVRLSAHLDIHLAVVYLSIISAVPMNDNGECLWSYYQSQLFSSSETRVQCVTRVAVYIMPEI